ncbi:hypothetical protein BU25DRAFT_422126 [Macroventuria anomochaeta]|uniref:Uncharacterized protein n=1 Tax=Macroventuria anomochaeta TaxID=301207 RepID=A0ACB6RYH5_9PLEO|nr:uncharacterized protein BU25DRAFT_422126 [Macroventuria anomochaeta]KAF2626773.1 hypothetical protein BU25DRAFT_422126 [Macroventuria anomochaeta]
MDFLSTSLAAAGLNAKTRVIYGSFTTLYSLGASPWKTQSGAIAFHMILHDIVQEIHKLDEWSAFRDINSQFLANVDPTDVFSNTYTLKKSDLYLKIAKPMQPALAVRAQGTNSLGESKKLGYVIKAGSTWLVESVKAILWELEIEHTEHSDENVIVCCLNRDRDGLACSEGDLIGFWKVQFRNICGVKISNVKRSTRKPPPAYRARSLMDFDPSVDTVESRDTVKEMLELAEARSNSVAPIDDKTSVQFDLRSWKPWVSLMLSASRFGSPSERVQMVIIISDFGCSLHALRSRPFGGRYGRIRRVLAETLACAPHMQIHIPSLPGDHRIYFQPHLKRAVAGIGCYPLLFFTAAPQHRQR